MGFIKHNIGKVIKIIDGDDITEKQQENNDEKEGKETKEVEKK